MNADDTLARELGLLPVSALSPRVRARTLALARGDLARSAAQASSLGLRVPACAASLALLSADAVFVADACAKIGRALGG